MQVARSQSRDPLAPLLRIWYSGDNMLLTKRVLRRVLQRSIGTDTPSKRPHPFTRSRPRRYVATSVVAMVLLCPFGRADAAAVLYSTQSREDIVAVYVVDEDGRLASDPFQRVSVGTNPRRLLATTRALYVAAKERIEALKIDPETGCLSWFRSSPAAETSCPRFLERPSRDDEDIVRPERVDGGGGNRAPLARRIPGLERDDGARLVDRSQLSGELQNAPAQGVEGEEDGAEAPLGEGVDLRARHAPSRRAAR